MEKGSTPEAETLLLGEPRPRRVFTVSPKFHVLLGSALVAGLIVHFQNILLPWSYRHAPKDTDIKPFSWEDLSAKPYLDYVPCYGKEYQCARLELPMDYFNGESTSERDVLVGLDCLYEIIRLCIPKPGQNCTQGDLLL